MRISSSSILILLLLSEYILDQKPAWDKNFFDWANRVGGGISMLVLSMRRCLLFYTEYGQEASKFILSLRRKPSIYTEYSLDSTEDEGRSFISH